MIKFERTSAMFAKGNAKNTAQLLEGIINSGGEVISVTTNYKVGFGKNWRTVIYYKTK